MKEEQDWRPRWLYDYSYSNVNVETLPISALYVMKYGRALDRLIREVIIEDPALGPVYVMEAGIINRFYHIGLRPTGAPDLGLFPPHTEVERIW